MQPQGSVPCKSEAATGSLSQMIHPQTLFLLRSILILSSYLHIVPPSGFFPLGFSTKILYAFLIMTNSVKIVRI
jgi:hypothetical protein